MCGIVGMVGPQAGEGMEAALQSIAHRGPDSRGTMSAPGWSMGIRRLSIIDVATGDQPLSNENNTIWVVCNGEIYNHAALRTMLRQRGHTFRTGSDVEVIVHLYEEYGERFVEHLQGMFGLFLATPDGCFIARDRLGIKPLYRARIGATVVVASEIRALLALPGIPTPATDDARLADYFVFRYVPEPRTAFVGIDRVRAGEIIRINASGETSRRYWQLQAGPPFKGTFEDAVAECESRLNTVVSMHLMSERPVGVFLSGGLDSSVVAALAARAATHPIQALTASFPGSDQDEADYAAEVAGHLGIEHHLIELSPSGVDDMTMATEVAEDLLADPALIPLMAVSRRARERLTVALVGEGSDETNIGYRSFLDLSRMVRRRRFGRLLPFAPRSGRWAHRLGFPALDDAGFLARFTNLAMPMHRFPPLLPHLTAPAERIREEVQRLAPDEHLSPFERNRQFRISGWMRDDLLVKVDKTTMAASIEARVPFLDHTYLEWAVTLPERFVLRNGQTKSVLRAIAERLLPPRIAGRKQHGLIVPLMAMLRSADARELREQLLSGKALWRRVFVEAPVRQIIDRFDAGDTSVAFFIYQLAQAELWQAHWLERHAASHAGVAG